MSYRLVYGLDAQDIDVVSDLITKKLDLEFSRHESMWLGEYNKFESDLDIKVKYNFVNNDEGWDFEEWKDWPILLVIEKIEDASLFDSLVNQLPFKSQSIVKVQWPKHLTS